MAIGTLTDAHFEHNAVDLSDHVRSVSVNYESETVDDTAMGTAGTRSFAAGLKNWSFDVELYADEAASSVNVTLFPDVGTSRTILVRPTSSAVSATNPNYTGTARLVSLTPISGTVGEMNLARARYAAADGSALSRATS